MNQYYSNYMGQLFALIRSKTSRSISYFFSANLLNAAIGFIGSIIVLRNLDAEAIGVLYPVVGIMMIATQFGDLGLSTSFVKLGSRYFSTDRDKALGYFKQTFLLKLLLTFLVLLVGGGLSGYISLHTFQTEKHRFLIMLIMGGACLQILSSYFQSSLQVEGKVKELSYLKVAPNILKFTVLLALIVLDKFSLGWVLAAFLLLPVCSLALGACWSSKSFMCRKKSMDGEFGELFKYSKWILVSGLCAAGIGQADILMVRSISGASELASLVGGQRLASVLPVFTTSLVTILLPKVAGMKNRAELNFYFRKSLLLIPVLILILLLGLPLAKHLIPFVLGEKYLASISIFQIYFAGFVVSAFITPLSLILYNLNKEHVFALMNLLQLAVNIIANYLVIPSWGANGAASVSVAIRLLAILIIFYVLWRSGILFRRKNG